TAVPGAVVGAIAVTKLPRSAFEILLGLVLVGAAVFLFFVKRGSKNEAGDGASGAEEEVGGLGPSVQHPKVMGMALSFGVGFLSSLLGIGGGIIHVPAMVHVLGFPVHVATATSHFVLATTAGAGTATHVFTGAFHTGWRRAVAIGGGALVGAQIGAWWARKTKAGFILKALAVALLIAGGRILVHGVWG
ncbi:MAG TPA: sulfite exporter TauE/SafE family protein, partial [Phycisphaerales bacterium]|nr:sulfite exporter TauE/SafE family protein [Phycisphaerales bacterium]